MRSRSASRQVCQSASLPLCQSATLPLSHFAQTSDFHCQLPRTHKKLGEVGRDHSPPAD